MGSEQVDSLGPKSFDKPTNHFSGDGVLAKQLGSFEWHVRQDTRLGVRGQASTVAVFLLLALGQGSLAQQPILVSIPPSPPAASGSSRLSGLSGQLVHFVCLVNWLIWFVWFI